jgi:Mg2+ and Co2+ transporter CorA
MPYTRGTSLLSYCITTLASWYVFLFLCACGSVGAEETVQESKVLQTNNIELTRELHILQAHLLHYQALLHNFELSVKFLAKTHNPAMDSDAFSDDQRKESEYLMKRESENLLSEIDRLEKRRAMQSNRLKNVMDLAFATVNIDDNSQTRKLTEATVRDSAAMKQVIPPPLKLK